MTVGFVVVENSHTRVSVNLKSQTKVFFFLNTTVTPSRILHCRYTNPILRISNQETRTLAGFATITAVNMVQNTFTHLHQKCEVTDEFCTCVNQYVRSLQRSER